MNIIPNSELPYRPSSRSSDVSLDMEEVGDQFVSVTVKSKPKGKYPAKLHAKSVAKHLGEKSGLIFLPGSPSLEYEDSDQEVYFRQRRYFYYLSGLDLPDCAVTYDIQKDSLCAFIPPPRVGRTIIYNGQRPSTEEIKSEYDFDDVQLITDLGNHLAKFINSNPRSPKIFLLHSYQAPNDALKEALRSSNQAIACRYCQRRKIHCSSFGEDPRCANCQRFQLKCSLSDGSQQLVEPSVRFDSSSLQPAMNAARVIHSSYEIKMIRKASAVTKKAHINVLKSIKALKSEAEIEAIFTATCIAEKAKKQAYGVIAGAGTNGSTLHYDANSDPLKGRQLVVLDAGCEWECYASDVTRTFPISGKHTTESKAIYDIVEKMQEECIAMIKPAADYRDIQKHASKVAVEGLMKLGLLQAGSFEDIYLSGVIVAFFPHGLGHYMGLEVHDVGDGGNLLMLSHRKSTDWKSVYTTLVNDPTAFAASILAPNQVITVEPGIYFSKYAIEEVALKDPKFSKYINKDLLAKYYPVGGVRIEDDILVTEDGYENLTTVPKGEEALKIISGEDEVVEMEKKKRRFW